MTKPKKLDKLKGLPAPLALTPEQLRQVAAVTAGGLGSLELSNWVIAGGPILSELSLSSAGQPSFGQQAPQFGATSF